MYRIRLEEFEGPLDLLLFFIRRDELDIYDIPIATIADEFLEYVRLMERIDLDGVGDFIYMAALLIHIKARMLLPQPEVDEDGEPVDPRRELVERLLEYVRYKEAAQHLAACQERRAQHFVRGNAGRADDEAAPEPEVDSSLFELMSALRRVLAEAPEDEPVHEIRRIEYTVEEQIEAVLEMLAKVERISFRRFVARRTKSYVIATFLAVLELARLRRVALVVHARLDDFELERVDTPDAVDLTPEAG
ncbi:MAG: segregation/condensation protein A [Bacteroidetes bacterium]|nr:MAG: segregation/condensation protein A [Bacteroidota bacterium]